MFKRSLVLPKDETFFLWGPRQSGKTSLLRQTFPDALWLDLLQADVYRTYLEKPERLRQELRETNATRVVIDEVQKVPALLDEVHWLLENTDRRFALCGSSARKVKRGHANLLGGRALRFELFGLSAHEIGSEFDLTQLLNRGYLPRLYQSSRASAFLDAYVADYLKEEIAAEGLVQNLPPFSRFLDIAALSDTALINFSTIARECGVSSPTIKSYFSILEDTLLGDWLPAYTARPKRRVIGAPKFFFADVGVVNALARRRQLEPGSEAFGKAFENWVYHELRTYIAYRERREPLSYWRLASGIEVDFVVGQGLCAIEAKASSKVQSQHTKGLREIAIDQGIERRYVVSLEPRARTTDEGITILPYQRFIQRLWADELF